MDKEIENAECKIENITAEKEDGTDPVPRPADKTSDEITPEILGELKADELRLLCKAAGLPQRGRKTEMIARLLAKKMGGDKKHIHGKTLCPHCKAPARVIGTRVVRADDVRPVYYRRYRCSGRRAHTFTIKN